MKAAFLKFVRDERGATAIEYGIIAGLMAMILIAIFGTTGSLNGGLTHAFKTISDALKAVS